MNTHNEYIKRDDVLKIISDVRLMSTGHTDNLSEVVECISNLKAEDVAPVRHGKWIDMQVRHNHALICSVCLGDTGVLYEYKVCPNCGAVMDGAE